jgi:diguanylate cyclase (GGDEF)-like protein
MFIAVIGFFVIKEIFDRIESVSAEAKLIAAGDVNRRLDVATKDEVGDLGEALNQLTQRIRSNMDELKSYGEKTTEINFEIQKRVLALSSLLQISSLISQGTNVEEILKITTEKSRLLANSDVAYLLFQEEGGEEFYIRTADGINSPHLSQIRIKPKESLFNKLMKINKPLILDKENIISEKASADFCKTFNLKNTLALSVILRGRIVGILGIGNNRQDFIYRKDDIDLLDIFAKQVAIALENDILINRLEKLEIKDALTGLYNEGFIRSRLEEEIKRSIMYQRPCSFILFNVDNFKEFHHNFGSLQAEMTLQKIASLIKDSVTDIDHVARFGDNEFAVVLPEKNKRKTQEIAQEIRKKIEFSFSEEPDIKKRLTISGGVSENPLDGIEEKELIAKAKEFLSLAKSKGKNCIVGSITKPA